MGRILFTLLVLGLAACAPKEKGGKQGKALVPDCSAYEFVSEIKYSKGFTIEKKDGYKEITVFNPWKKDEVLKKYVLIPKGEKAPSAIDESSCIVRVPVESLVLFSNIHVGSVVKLGLEDKVLGMTRASRVYNRFLYERVRQGKIANVGGAHNKNIDIEKIIELDPELIILSAYNEVKAGESQLEEIGMNMAYALNWMEETPLGRAEWLKFTASFFNKEAMADSIFNDIEKNYNGLKEKLVGLKNKPNVLLGWSYNGTWYMPGGNNYMVSYLKDAGANYFLFTDQTRGNIPMSVESVLDQCNDTDIWIYPGACKSMNEIENSGEIFTQFKAWQNQEVYNIYKRANPNGGSDWWESGSVSPDIVLKDFMKILHPELFPADSTYFISKLKHLE